MCFGKELHVLNQHLVVLNVLLPILGFIGELELYRPKICIYQRHRILAREEQLGSIFVHGTLFSFNWLPLKNILYHKNTLLTTFNSQKGVSLFLLEPEFF